MINLKKIIALALCLSFVICCAPLAAVKSVTAEADLSDISWFTAGMTVKEAREISSALKTFTRDGRTLLSDDTLRTGDIVKNDYCSYNVIVRGDVMGEGKTSALGYIAIKRHCMKTMTLTGSQAIAADIDSDSEITPTDYIMMKRAVMGTYEIKKPENASGVPVLLYHHMVEDKDKENAPWNSNDITISTSEFTRQMQMITDRGHYVATLDEVVAYVRGEILLPSGAIALTFDDGYRSNTYYAAPILKQFGYKATVFSVMYHMDTEYQEFYDVSKLQHITRKDLEPVKDVIDQQCHTYNNHTPLANQTYEQIYADLMKSQECYPAEYFAYPNGSYDDKVISAAKAAGFLAGFSTVERNAAPGDDIYLIPRYTVTSPWTDSKFESLLNKAK